MRLTVLAAVSLLAVAAAGCTNETLDSFDKVDVDISRVSSKTGYQLSPAVLSKLSSMGIDRSSPMMLRIFKEEGRLELWKADRTNRFKLVRNYKICAWSGKLGPKTKEGDRQAPEGFYPLSRANMNPNSSYYLAINTGFPNDYDRANKASGTHLMIHGACSSSGCYSMTDEQMVEIFAFARDAFDGGREKRNVVFEYDTISITPPDTEAKVNQIKSNQYSDEKFIELGLGRRAKAVHHFIYDGTQVISTHDRTQSATFSAPKDGGYSVIESQDPRMMGLAISGSLKLELGNILYNYENNIKITHEEVISGEKAWCVEMQRVNNPDMKLLFWISDSEGFKVWRVKTTYKNKIVSLINCEYHHSDGKNPFPTYVQMYPVYGPNAEPIEEISIKEVASDYSYKAKEKEFTLAGLGLLPGATVGDSRIPKILGYWDGEKITRIYTQLFERATNCSPNKPKKKLLIGQGGPCGWVVSWVS